MNAKRQTMSLGTQMAPLGTGDAVVYMGDIYQVQIDINVEANKTVVLALRQPH